jgi:hypothetical protein
VVQPGSWCVLHAGFLLALLFNTEDIGLFPHKIELFIQQSIVFCTLTVLEETTLSSGRNNQRRIHTAVPGWSQRISVLLTFQMLTVYTCLAPDQKQLHISADI